MHLRGGCRDDVTICRSGVNSNHNVTLDCRRRPVLAVAVAAAAFALKLEAAEKVAPDSGNYVRALFS
jgi:hypothetical protein